MTKARYQTSITLTEEENILVQALKEEKIGTIDIFRKGLEVYAPKVPKELEKKVRDMISRRLG